jgi:phosphoglycerol transferase MdoB-like AlkP superfamily enzyme
MSNKQPIPRIALVLGLAGLIPFFTLASLLWVRDASALNWFWLLLLIGYGAVILSFLGGVRWGFEIARTPSNPSMWVMVGSVVPSIIGWLAFGTSIVPNISSELPILGVFGLYALIAGFAAQWFWDTRTTLVSGLPAWYPPLRTILTIGAVLALILGVVAHILGPMASS